MVPIAIAIRIANPKLSLLLFRLPAFLLDSIAPEFLHQVMIGVLLSVFQQVTDIDGLHRIIIQRSEERRNQESYHSNREACGGCILNYILVWRNAFDTDEGYQYGQHRNASPDHNRK